MNMCTKLQVDDLNLMVITLNQKFNLMQEGHLDVWKNVQMGQKLDRHKGNNMPLTIVDRTYN